MKEEIQPCPCGHNRWKTIEKGKAWMCRKCNTLRKIEIKTVGELKDNPLYPSFN